MMMDVMSGGVSVAVGGGMLFFSDVRSLIYTLQRWEKRNML